MPLLVYASVDFRTVEQAVEHFIKPEHWRVIPLYAAPPQERVSEAMVERLCEELMQECDAGGPVLECDIFLGEASWSCRTDAVRRALTAALAPSRRAPSGDGKGKP
jgi:hypothetical protein